MNPIEKFKLHLDYQPKKPMGLSLRSWFKYLMRCVLFKIRQLILGKTHVDLLNALEVFEHLQGEIRGSFPKSSDYFEFENQFRGKPELIKERLKIYWPHIKLGSIIDLGCGRGEFMELLKTAGCEVVGVDFNPVSVQEAQNKGLKAFCGDLFDFLEAQENESLDTIFSAQVIEHISFPMLVKMVETAFRKLKPGGKLILETPNPQALIVFSESYFMDPTHFKLIHPYTLRFLCQRSGFNEVDFLYSSPAHDLQDPKIESIDPSLTQLCSTLKNINQLVFGYRDYAIIAQK